MEVIKQSEVVIMTHGNVEECGFTLQVIRKQEEIRFLRLIKPSRVEFVRSLFENKIIERLIKEGYLVEMWINSNVLVEGYEEFMVVESKYIPYVCAPSWYNIIMKAYATLKMYKLGRVLLEYNLGISDPSLYNIAFDKEKPVLIDLGSIKESEKCSTLSSIYSAMEVELLSYSDGNYEQICEYGFSLKLYNRFFKTYKTILRLVYYRFLDLLYTIMKKYPIEIINEVCLNILERLNLLAISRIERSITNLQKINTPTTENSEEREKQIPEEILSFAEKHKDSINSVLCCSNSLLSAKRICEIMKSDCQICLASYTHNSSAFSYSKCHKEELGFYNILFNYKEKVERNQPYVDNIKSDMIYLDADVINYILVNKRRRLIRIYDLIKSYANKYACIELPPNVINQYEFAEADYKLLNTLFDETKVKRYTGIKREVFCSEL